MNTARIEDGPGGLPVVVIDTSTCTGRFFPYAAHVAEWAPRGEAPVLFMSPNAVFAEGKAIRGGVPICFPWFGRKHDDAAAPQHGFARTRTWRLDTVRPDDDGKVTIEAVLPADDASRALWPYKFEARLTAVFGKHLSVTLTTKNTGDVPFDFEAALHSYFAVGDVRAARLTGLGGARYLDKTEGYAEKVQEEPALVVGGEVDRQYVSTKAAVMIEDPVLGRAIQVEKVGSTTTVVWNPWTKASTVGDLGEATFPKFVCVEAAVARPQGVQLAPGASHELVTRVRVSRLGG